MVGVKTKTLEERFWIKVNKTDTCWLWTGARKRAGYGVIGSGSTDTLLAHRVSWNIHFGEIQNGLYVCHRCDTTACVNPEHLFLGTHSDNMADMALKGRHAKISLPGEANGHSKLTEQDVITIRELYKNGFSPREIAKSYSIAHSSIFRIVNRKAWAHIP